jgi:A/G-specific adenine glycosylase
LEKQTFGAKLMEWYEAHKRALPWRETDDPYHIWLSEIILQQTRVAQGLPYYERFVAHFPTVQDLAKAEQEAVLKLWEGLGYYSRARNMHAAAQQVVTQFKGRFPPSYAELLTLKGVGSYTAAAIASFAFNLPHAVLDGNVYRVLARLFGIYAPINTPKAQKVFGELAQELLHKGDPALYNQAIMEFGATLCTPARPDCEQCPFQESCYAFAEQAIAALPARQKAKAKRTRHFYYAHIIHQEEVLVQQRATGDIWAGLYEFPLLEKEQALSRENVLAALEAVGLWHKDAVLKQSISLPVHLLSHQRLVAEVLVVELRSRKGLEEKGRQWVSAARLKELPMPVLLRKYLNQNQLPLPF